MNASVKDTMGAGAGANYRPNLPYLKKPQECPHSIYEMHIIAPLEIQMCPSYEKKNSNVQIYEFSSLKILMQSYNHELISLFVSTGEEVLRLQVDCK